MPEAMAIILAAGCGRRMRPLTDQAHKTLLPIAGDTILGRIVRSLVLHDVAPIVVVTGYRRDDVERFLRGGFPEVDFQLVHNERYNETNNITSLAMALQQTELTKDVILIESDLIYDSAIIDRLLRASGENVALVDRFRPGMDGTVVSVANGAIVQVYPPHLQGEDFDYADKWKTLNIYRFTQEFCTSTFAKLLDWYAHTIDESCYYELVLGMLIFMQNQRVRALDVDGARWAEVDDPNDLNAARYLFNEEDRQTILDESYGGFWNYEVLDGAFIRNMYFPTGAVLSAIRQTLPRLLQSYGSAQSILNQKLGYHLLVRPERLQVLNGLSQIYPLLRARCGDRRALIPAPSFGEYARTFPDATTYSDAVGIDLDEVEARAGDRDVVVFCNPQNPTGTTIETGWLHAFAGRHPQKLFLVDESFADFCEQPSLQALLEEAPLDNVVVLKSLSKSLGVPGLRLGYTYTSSDEWNRWLRDAIPIWNLNALAEFYLETLLKFRPEVQESYAQTRADRAQLVDLLERSGAVEQVFPSGANFVLCRLRAGDRGFGARVVAKLLADETIYLKDVSERFPGAASYLRIAVRLPEENARIVRCLTQATRELRQGGEAGNVQG